MDEKQLKQYLKEHLSIRVEENSDSDGNIFYSVGLMLDGEKIGDEEAIHVG